MNTVRRNFFDSPEFESQSAAFPYMQVLNDQDPDKSGFFLTLENADKCGFIPGEDWRPHSNFFRSGDSSEGYIASTGRFLILRQSPLLMFEREGDRFVDVFDRAKYDNATIVLKTRYLVYLVNQQRQLLHEKPLQLTTKGSFCGVFGEVHQRFRALMSGAYKQANNNNKDRSDRFFALSILAVQLSPKLKGGKKKAWVCDISNFAEPTAENWRSLFVGYEAFRDRVLEQFDECADFGNPERERKTRNRTNTVDTVDYTALGTEDDLLDITDEYF
ncbi:hypothetical protein IQ268_16985 [Oculatella sp. LEGE 06141]|uniref:DUF5895 domain-containing protein n=1 Tax=Oculatella sp. LEGE 06141 TaxID=1828648 RepID=UPI0018829931|nr:DUF5895 domain-containing protein [Oculatella sp. LEGE 06141]MBE9180260.1 hypothetical protein [Oculatella sp. LEGE 06141]